MGWISKITDKVKNLTNKVWDNINSPNDILKTTASIGTLGLYNTANTYKDSVKAQKQATQLAEDEYNNQLKQQEETKQELLNERIDTINKQREQLLNSNTYNNERKKKSGIGSNKFSLLDNDKTLG